MSAPAPTPPDAGHPFAGDLGVAIITTRANRLGFGKCTPPLGKRSRECPNTIHVFRSVTRYIFKTLAFVEQNGAFPDSANSRAVPENENIVFEK
jgi:hypothetical protein